MGHRVSLVAADNMADFRRQVSNLVGDGLLRQRLSVEARAWARHWAKLAVNGLSLFWNYLARRWFVFRADPTH